jgi:hypothetical protein
MQFEMRRLSDYSDQSILDEIKRVAALITVPALSKVIFRRHSKVSPTTIVRRFGNWEKALHAAGLTDRYDWSNKAERRKGTQLFSQFLK